MRSRRLAAATEAGNSLGPSLLDLPHEVLVEIAQRLEDGELADLLRLGQTCRQLRQLSLEPLFSTVLEIDYGEGRWDRPVDQRLVAQHESLIAYVERRRATLQRLTIAFPGCTGGADEWQELGHAAHVRWGLPPAIDHPMHWVARSALRLVAAVADVAEHLDLRFAAPPHPLLMHWDDGFVPMSSPRLHTLRLSNPYLPGMPPSITTLSGSLTQLAIRQYEAALPGLSMLGQLTQLVELQLCKVLEKEPAPAELSALTNLTLLTLDSNWVSTWKGAEPLPACYSTLRQLQDLRIRDCRLLRVPAVVQHFTGLRTLVLDSNLLTPQGVPLALNRLQELRMLGLSWNSHLNTIPEAFVACGKLEELHLDSIDICSLPPGPYLSRLEVLKMAHNPALPAAQLESLRLATRLRSLSMHATRDGDGELPEAICQLSALTHLDCSQPQMSCDLGTWRFPAGPWACNLQCLDVDGLRLLARYMDPCNGEPALPLMPRLKWLSWVQPEDVPLTAPAARMLLQQTPALRTLLLSHRAGASTAAARQVLSDAGVQIEMRWMRY